MSSIATPTRCTTRSHSTAPRSIAHAAAWASTLDELVASLRAELAEARQARAAEVDGAIAAIQGQLAQQSALLAQSNHKVVDE